MTAEDTWQLKIPIRLCLSSSEITSPVDVKPAYLLAPRYAYLPALAEQCLALFQHVLLSLPGQAEPTPWFEQQGLPLNWTQPLGVLHDLLTPSLPQPGAANSQQQQQQQQQQQTCSVSAPVTPWCLTVHYRNMPGSLSNSWQNAGTAKDYFFSGLKEAGYCCRGSEGSAAVMRLPGQAQDELWAAVNRGDGAAARRVTTPLRLNPTARQPSAAATVPVRLFIRSHTAGSKQDLTTVWEHTYSSSRPVEALQPDGSPTLLAHLMHAVLPQQFPAPVPPAAAATGAALQQEPRGQQKKEQQQQQGSDAVLEPTAGSTEQQRQRSAAEPDPLGAAARAADAAAAGITHASDDGRRTAVAAGEDSSRAVDDEPGGTAAGDDAKLAGETDATLAAVLADQEGLGVQGSGAGREALAAAAAAAVPSHELPDGWPGSTAAVFVCGVQPDWLTPLVWLHANMKAADCFLYIVVHLVQ